MVLMSKFNKVSKLSQKERNELFLNFCQTLADLKRPKEVALFLKDLLGVQEMEMLSKRLEIAKLLIEGLTYEEISEVIKVSSGTVARVNFWLQMSGSGYRMVAQEAKKKEKKYSQWDEDWKSYKRSHSRYFWPELLFENIMKEIGNRKKKKLLEILSTLDNKDKINKEFDKYLQETYGKKPKTPPA